MKPVFQTKYGFPDGNCFMACVASILEIPIEDCPDLCAATDGFAPGTDWGAIAREWAYRQHDMLMVAMFPSDDGLIKPPMGYSIVGGRGPLGQMHACVALDGEIVHDPHPNGRGIREIFDYTVLIALHHEERVGVKYSDQVPVIKDQLQRAGADPYTL